MDIGNIVWQALKRKEICLETEVDSKMEPLFFAEGIVVIDYGADEESDGLIIFGCLLKEASRKNLC